MTSYDEVSAKMLTALLDDHDPDSDEATKIIKNLKMLNDAKPAEPTPEKEEARQGWLEKHSEVLIKSGFSLLGVLAIVGGEKLGNHIYNTSAWKTFQK